MTSRAAASARRREDRMALVSFSASVALERAAAGRPVAGDVVGLDPAGRSDREAALGADGKLACSLYIATGKCRLSGGEIGLGQVALAAIGHGELGVAFGRLRLARQ